MIFPLEICNCNKELMHVQEIKIDDIITHNLPFRDINKAFDLMVAGKCLRCVIHMPNE